MSDIATISLRVNTSELEKGSQKLDEFGSAAGGAAKSADNLGSDIDQVHKRVGELRKRLEESTKAAQNSGAAQDALAETFMKQIDSIKSAGDATERLATISASLRAARRAGNIDEQNYLSLISDIAKKQSEVTKSEQATAAAREIFIKKLKDQVTTQKLSREELIRYRAAQLGVSSSAEIYIQTLERSNTGTQRLGKTSAVTARNIRTLAAQMTSLTFGGGAAGTGLSLLSSIGVATPAVTAVTLAFGGLIESAYKTRKEIEETGTTVRKTLGISGDAAEKLTLNIRAIAKASGESVESITGMFITTKDGASEAIDKLISVGFSYQDAKDKVEDYKGSADFTALNGMIDEHHRKINGIRDGWSEAAAKIREDYTAAAQGLQPVALGGAIDPIVSVIENAKDLQTTINDLRIEGNKQVKTAVDWINREFKSSDRVAGAQARLNEAKKNANRISASGDQEAISNANKLVAIREKELADSKKKTTETKTQKSVSDDLATRELASSQQRLAALREQGTTTAKLTSQEQQLVKFNQQIADLKEKSILTADQKSLLARESELRASLQMEVSTANVASANQRATAAMEAMNKYGAQALRNNEQAAASHGLTSKQIQNQAQLQQLKNTYEKEELELRNAINKAELSGAAPEEVTRLRQELEKLKTTWLDTQGVIEQGQADAAARSADWGAGIVAGTNQWTESATDMYGNMQGAATNALNTISGTLTDLVTTGTADFRSMTTSILSYLAEIMVKMALAGAMKSAFGFSDGGYVPFANGGFVGPATAMKNGFAGGGFTGNGGKYQPKGVVHGGEFVFTKEATKALGVGQLYGLMHAAEGGGYADGGFVGSAPMVGISGAAGGLSVTLGDVNLNIETQGGAGDVSSGNTAEAASQLQGIINKTIVDWAKKALSPGGLLYKR